MKKAIITEKCLGDPICLARLRCPAKAIRKTERRTRMPIWFFRYSEVDHKKCLGCGRCVKVCLHKAIKLVQIDQPVHR